MEANNNFWRSHRTEEASLQPQDALHVLDLTTFEWYIPKNFRKNSKL